MGIQSDVVNADGVLLGVAVEDNKRGGFVALLTFGFLLGDVDYDDCWPLGTFPTRDAAEHAVRVGHRAFRDRGRRQAEHLRRLAEFVATHRGT